MADTRTNNWGNDAGRPITSGITLRPLCPQCGAKFVCAADAPGPWRCPQCGRHPQAAELRHAIAEILSGVTVTCGECWAPIPLTLESFSEGVVCNECNDFFLANEAVAAAALKVMDLPCPKCHKELEYDGKGWACRACGHEVPAAEAVAAFPETVSVPLLLMLDALVNNQYARLTPGDWLHALLLYPELAAQCPWKTLTTSDWARGLMLTPVPLSALKACPWDDFTAVEWAAILSCQPDFAPRCPFAKLDHEAWTELLLTQRDKFAAQCPWKTLTPDDWRALLAKDSAFFSPHLPTPTLERLLAAPGEPPTIELSSRQWAQHLLASPTLRHSPRCPWGKLKHPEVLQLFRDDPAGSAPHLSVDNWHALLRDEPELARQHIPVDACRALAVRVREDFPSMLGPDDWMRLLRTDCEFFGPHCSLDAIGVENAFILAEERPDEFNAHFATPGKWETLFATDADRAWKLIPRSYLESCYGDDAAKGMLCNLWQLDWNVRPDLTDNFPYDKLSLGNWLELLSFQPQQSKRFHRWTEITLPQWRELVNKQPGFVHICNLRFPPSGEVFVKELLERPTLAPLADFTKLSGEDWLRLVAAAREYADKCDWKKVAAFYRFDWRPALEMLPESALASQLRKRYAAFPDADRLAMLRDIPTLNQLAPQEAFRDIDLKLWLGTVFAVWDKRGEIPSKPDYDFPWQCFSHAQLNAIVQLYPGLRRKIVAWLAKASAKEDTAFLVSAATYLPEELENCVAARAKELSLDDWRELIPLYPPFGDLVPGGQLPKLMATSAELSGVLSDEQLAGVTPKEWLTIIENCPEWTGRCNFRGLSTWALFKLWFKISDTEWRQPVGAVLENRVWIVIALTVGTLIALGLFIAKAVG